MRKVNEIIMVIVAAGLAAAVALIEIPTRSAAPGTVVGGGAHFTAPPPIRDPTFPPLPPLLFPPGSAAPVPTGTPATSASSLALGAEPPQGVTRASSPASGVLGTALARHAPTPTAKPPPAAEKPKPTPATEKPTPKLKKPKPAPAAEKPKPEKPKPAPATDTPTPTSKPEDSRNATLAGVAPVRSTGQG
jgi:outer membrane biosynthesis protein TonB